jgi:hypothetical protein
MELIDHFETEDYLFNKYLDGNNHDRLNGRWSIWHKKENRWLYGTERERVKDKEVLKRNKEKKMLNISSNAITFVQDYSLADCQETPAEAQPLKLMLKLKEAVPKKKEKTMCYDDFDDCICETNTRTPEQQKAAWLINELDRAFGTKDRELNKTFRMNGAPGPTTLEEFLQRMKDGKYTIEKNYLNDDGTIRKNSNYSMWNGLYTYINWETPETAPDHAGYKAASEKLSAAFKDAQRIIQIDTPMNGLAALKEFESKTFH